MKKNLSSRRRLLSQGARLAAAAALPMLTRPARASAPGARALAMSHTHTHERIELVYADAHDYLPQSLQRLNHFLRDHYSGEVGRIDPPLFDILHGLRRVLGASGGYEIISGYRCAATNERLRSTRGGGVAKRSLHMDGRALDVRLSGVPLAELRDAAIELGAGGVGYYPNEQFVHLDTGRVRRW
ncbi:MAG TPA: DUF882 domain-containing protein [Rubrivivax sp.]|nr:DUF882 domain-containing protein [Rubrivivax sp.]HPO18207.1 DUF882 domain-containing protein [Rubrivivax sp.]